MSTKNHSGDKRGGFVPLDDIAGAVELPNGRALTPAAPQALHHFTRLDQIDQLVEASEADSDLGFMARLLALCSLPRTNPGDQKEYIRRNGPYTLGMSAGINNKLPYGNLPCRDGGGIAVSALCRARGCHVGRDWQRRRPGGRRYRARTPRQREGAARYHPGVFALDGARC